MISMIEHIEYLMLSNDCVVVPGFGAFIAQYTSSHNCAQNSTFTSPILKYPLLVITNFQAIPSHNYIYNKITKNRPFSHKKLKTPHGSFI